MTKAPSIDSEKETGKSNPNAQEGPADFETAIAATGYGRFNYLLLLIALPCCTTTVFETTTMSYVLPSAECDLELSLVDKGTLNAVTYVGMISSAFLWGFLSDSYGRKQLLIYGFFLDATLNLLCASSQTVLAIMIFKFMGGFVICGPFAVLMAYLSEFHSLEHRSRVMIMVGIFYSIANILLPSLAWVIIPQNWDFMLFGGNFVIHSWQIFLAVSCVPSLLSGILVLFLPESPKFLMSKGHNERALEVFRTLYALNSGRSRHEYPIKELVNELMLQPSPEPTSVSNSKPGPEDSAKPKAPSGGLQLLTVMFRRPHLRNSLLAYSIQFGILLGLNTFRLWVPQLFTIIDEFDQDRNAGFSRDSASLCEMLAYKVNKTNMLLETGSSATTTTTTLEVRPLAAFDMEELDLGTVILCEATTEGSMYLKSLIIGCVGLFAYLVTTVLINAIGNRNILVYGLSMAGLCGLALYWTKTSASILALSSAYITLASIASTALIGSVVAMFPTSMRTMVVSLTMMCGRTGSIIGNVLFPYLMSLGCWPPFLMIGTIQIAVSLLATTIPKTLKKPLQ
ncbi:synaptic vesicle glycoprotein 2C-like [Uranotaenia lowii]|uniref:synaptic vesicle glycoprotein 2C-like n=1 Tax=Uranotaenia lowii TaxID=190385 RepID=UPI0024793F57|nr:synaptic vesicle glycoprotein 2C-like [Uranotaenia lowii]